MTIESSTPATFSFGPFELNAATGELRRNGSRVRLSGQPFRILVALLSRPGELVTREQLRAEVWADSTFVDFEHGLNAAMNKLRRALGDAAENPRYIETHLGRGYRFIGTLQNRDTPQSASPGTALPERAPIRRIATAWWWLAGIAACLLSFVVGWRLRNPAPSPPPWKLSRMTADAGFSDSPALSPDGKLLAYSSDRGGNGGQDLYVKQVSGGQPIRLTSDGAGNEAPNFSPDGTMIAFQSSRDGGGIYEIPAFGGEARLLTKGGQKPRFSPDGSRIAYWVGGEGVAANVPGSGQVWVVPVAGGHPWRVGAKFTAARHPIWSPDGQHLLFIGYTSNKAAESSSLDWWVVATDKEEAVRTGMFDALSRAGLQLHMPVASAPSSPTLPIPGCWLAGSNSVIFSSQNGDTWNLWQTGISPETGRVDGQFKRLTAGSGNEEEPSCASGDTFAFTNTESTKDIWSLPFDLDHGKAKGALERTTEDHSVLDPSLSGDGRFVAFASGQSGPLNTWVRDLQTGKESLIAGSSMGQRFPAINASGTKVAYSVYEGNKRSIYLWTSGGTPEKLCEGCLRATDWSRDETSLLVFGGSPYQISLLDIASRQQTPLLKHATENLIYGRFSPDNHWISFTARIQPDRAILAIAPLDGPKPVPESSWIKIAEERITDWANWSPDGKTLYFTSARDGHACVWAQRLDPHSHRPVGAAFAVQHFHGRATYQQEGWSAAGDRIAAVLVDGTKNIWMMSRSPAP